MRMKNNFGLFVALALSLCAPAAYANFLTISPLNTVTDNPSEVTLEIHMRFRQETVGGAFDLLYDSNILSLVSFEYDEHFLSSVVDPDFLLLPDDCMANGSTLGGCSPGDAELNAIGFGNFDGIVGTYLIARVTFATLQPGDTLVLLAATDSPFGGFISAAHAENMDIFYGGAHVLVTPIPAAVWMMLSALGVLLAIRRN